MTYNLAYAEQISFTIATLNRLRFQRDELPKVGPFPVLHARYTDGKITAGYMVTTQSEVPGGVVFGFTRIGDNAEFNGFFRLDAHANGAMFASSVSPDIETLIATSYVIPDLASLSETELAAVFDNAIKDLDSKRVDRGIHLFDTALDVLGFDQTIEPFNEFVRALGKFALTMPTKEEQETMRRRCFKIARRFSKELKARGLN